ncbi:MAG TPA: hypothetical protein VKG65_03495 [Terriglobales bacterium]|nr:hypothetical protein [Terriglobales bacterium]
MADVSYSVGKIDLLSDFVGLPLVQTPDRYLGCKQRISQAVNDNLGLDWKTLDGARHATQADFGKTV